jgi:outer membrane protein
MRVFATASLVLFLCAAPVLAQSGSQAKPAPQSNPAPTASQAPAQKPPAAQPSTPAPTVQPPVPFPQDAKIAFVNLQRVATESAEGKNSVAKVNNLVQSKQNEGADRNKALQANQQKLDQSGSVLSESARAQLQKEIERQQTEIQRFQQDAQSEINDLQQQLQTDFINKISPVLQAVATERKLQILFNASDAGFAWVDPGLDLTDDVIQKLDAASKATK